MDQIGGFSQVGVQGARRRETPIRILASFALFALAAPVVDAQSTAMTDAIAEFRRLTANLGTTETSGADGGVVTASRATVRPAWHGRLYENFRNNALDAIPHEIVQRNQPQRKLRRNQFGLNVTGPVYIPKIYNGTGRTFFTLSYEGMREILGQSQLNTIPTTLERTGSFGHVVDIAGRPLPIYDPLTTSLNPDYNPALPVSRSNLLYNRLPFDGNTIPQDRLDQAAMEAMNYYPQPNTAAGPFFRNNYFVVSNQVNNADGFILTLDHTFLEKNRVTVRLNNSGGQNGRAPIFPTAANPQSPNVDVSSRGARLEHIYTASAANINTFRLEASSNRAENQSQFLPNGKVFPRYQIDGYQSMGNNMALGYDTTNVFLIGNAFSTRKGNHRLSLGLELQQTQINTFRPFGPEGIFNFDAGYSSLPGIINTGHPFATFLLGAPSDLVQNVVTSPSYFRWDQQRYLFGDQWQVTPSLTLTLGANLEIYGQRTEKYDRQSNISLDVLNPVNGLPGALVVANQGGQGRTFPPTWKKVEPSIGIAWSVLGDNNTVLRLSWDRRYGGPDTANFQWGTQAFNGRRTYVAPNAQLEPALFLENGIPEDQVFPDLRPEAANGTQANIFDVSNRQPTQQNFEASIQRQLAPFLILTVTGRYEYTRNQLLGRNTINPNAVPLDALVYRDQLNDLNFRNSLRPYPQFQDFDPARFWPGGSSKTKLFTARLEKRTSGGLALTVSYQYQWQISNSGNIQDYYNLNNEWAQSAGQPHSVNLDYIYELPFGPGKQLLSGGGLLASFLGGWAISGQSRFFTGGPLLLQAQFNNTGTVVPSLRPNMVEGVDPHVENPGPALWFNPEAFVQPPNFTIGNTPRAHPTLRGPGGYNHDITLNKRIQVGSDRTLEFTASLFNATNHANWNDPDTRIGPASAPNANAGRIIGSSGGRIVQLGLRLNF